MELLSGDDHREGGKGFEIDLVFAGPLSYERQEDRTLRGGGVGHQDGRSISQEGVAIGVLEEFEPTRLLERGRHAGEEAGPHPRVVVRERDVLLEGERHALYRRVCQERIDRAARVAAEGEAGGREEFDGVERYHVVPYSIEVLVAHASQELPGQGSEPVGDRPRRYKHGSPPPPFRTMYGQGVRRDGTASSASCRRTRTGSTAGTTTVSAARARQQHGEGAAMRGTRTACLALVLALAMPAGSPSAATAEPAALAVQAQPGILDAVAADIDAFWAAWFAAAELPYATPGVVGFDTPIATACGPADPDADVAFYCPDDTTIYFAVWYFIDREVRFGDYAWINILAHEWGHHVQFLVGTPRVAGSAFELQADCLAGSYARDAAARGLLDRAT
jgi:hypothetical protein